MLDLNDQKIVLFDSCINHRIALGSQKIELPLTEDRFRKADVFLHHLFLSLRITAADRSNQRRGKVPCAAFGRLLGRFDLPVIFQDPFLIHLHQIAVHCILCNADSITYRLCGGRHMMLPIILIDKLFDLIHQFRIFGSHMARTSFLFYRLLSVSDSFIIRTFVRIAIGQIRGVVYRRHYFPIIWQKEKRCSLWTTSQHCFVSSVQVITGLPHRLHGIRYESEALP